MTQHFRLETIDGITAVIFGAAKFVPETKVPPDGPVEDEGHRMLLDLSNVRFLTSNAPGILVALKKKVDVSGCDLATSNPTCSNSCESRPWTASSRRTRAGRTPSRVSEAVAPRVSVFNPRPPIRGID